MKHIYCIECKCPFIGEEELVIIITSGIKNSNKDHTLEMWKTNLLVFYQASVTVNQFCLFLDFFGLTTRTQKWNDKV